MVAGLVVALIKSLPGWGWTGFLGSLKITLIKKEDWKILKILNVKTEDFKIV